MADHISITCCTSNIGIIMRNSSGFKMKPLETTFITFVQCHPSAIGAQPNEPWTDPNSNSILYDI